MVEARPPPNFCSGPMPYDCGSARRPSKREGYFPNFVNNLVSPFMRCWQPPINTCDSPERARNASVPIVSPQHAKPQETTDIREPHSNDVLCGRGGSSNRHVGNLNFRCLVSANKDMYVTLTKKQKMTVARKIVDLVHGQSPAGRFLQKDPITGLWFDIGLPRSLEKTSQALREKTGNALESPASPGGSCITDVTAATDESLFDHINDVNAPSCKSPASHDESVKAENALSASSQSTKGNSAEVPEISIPDHLEHQFRPEKVKENHESAPPEIPLHRPIQSDYYAPRYPRPHPFPHHGPPPSQPYMHHYHPPPPPPPPPPEYRSHDYYRHARTRFPYPVSTPLGPRHPPRHYPNPVYASSDHIPPSPDRYDYSYHDPRHPVQHHSYYDQSRSPYEARNYVERRHSKPGEKEPSQEICQSGCDTPDRTVSQNEIKNRQFKSKELSHNQITPVETIKVSDKAKDIENPKKVEALSLPELKASGTSGRQTSEVSPGRAQVSKKRRTYPDELLLTQDLTRQLSLEEGQKDIASPSAVLQSRSRRGTTNVVPSTPTRNGSEEWSNCVDRGGALAGLAALSSAALLQLVAEQKK